MLEKDGCWLYELYNATVGKKGSWSASSTAVWNMTSADAASRTTAMMLGKSLPVTDQDIPYKGVWHLPNGATLTANDSTSNANTATVSGATATG